MWGRKDQDSSGTADPTLQTGMLKPTARQPVSKGSAASSQPRAGSRSTMRHEAPEQTPSQIAKSVKFKGEIHSDEDLVIDGIVEGTISIPKHVLVIGANSRVSADVHAHSLVLFGKLAGEVSIVERIEIKKTGSLRGNLVTHRIVIEHGGIFHGTCDTRNPESREVDKGAAKASRRAGAASPTPRKPERPAVQGSATPRKPERPVVQGSKS